MSVKLGLLGGGIGYSLSPKLHTLMWQMQKESASDRVSPVFPFFQQAFEYSVLDTQESMSASLTDFLGLQVTQPWKSVVSRMLPGNDFGNTLVNAGGSWSMHDTDLAGLYSVLENKNPKIFDTPVIVVFGLGGLAKKFLLSCQQRFANLRQVHVVVRNPDKARTWIKDQSLEFATVCPWDASALDETIETVETSEKKTVGMPYLALQLSSAPHSGDSMAGFDSLFGAAQLVFDACYNPCIAYGSGSHANFVGGLEMLVVQALEAWKLWGLPVVGLDIQALVQRLFEEN